MSRHPQSADVSETGFRRWLELLRGVRGHRPLWPVLLGATLEDEFQRQIENDKGYSGRVFIDRDSHPLEDGDREERLVARLYRSALSSDGCVLLENERIWLLGYQWPTQGGHSEKGRRADLVGITTDGAIVVFEAKAASGNAPWIAIMEGLDYLACLLRSKNFDNILSVFEEWRRKPGKAIPPGFEQATPSRLRKPKLVLLAPESYFTGRQFRSVRGRDWPYLAAVGDTMMDSVSLAFAATDFHSTTLWKPPIPKK
jgi:hypothetical protein